MKLPKLVVNPKGWKQHLAKYITFMLICNVSALMVSAFWNTYLVPEHHIQPIGYEGSLLIGTGIIILAMAVWYAIELLTD